MCVCVRASALIFESIGCSITAHFTFKTHHVAWTLTWILQPRSGVYFSHYAFHIESSKRTLILCSVRQNQVQMCCAEREQYWWQGRLGWHWLWEHDQDAFADAILLMRWHTVHRCSDLWEDLPWPWATLTAGSTLESSGRLDEGWKVRYCGLMLQWDGI